LNKVVPARIPQQRSYEGGQLAHVRLESRHIIDWSTFHAECQRALGFPGFYGANMNAWIGCMSCLRDPGEGMSSVALGRDGSLELEIPSAEDFRKRLPLIAEALWDCTSFVNRRYVNRGEQPAILLVPVAE
jgi:hypothetical protein